MNLPVFALLFLLAWVIVKSELFIFLDKSLCKSIRFRKPRKLEIVFFSKVLVTTAISGNKFECWFPELADFKTIWHFIFDSKLLFGFSREFKFRRLLILQTPSFVIFTATRKQINRKRNITMGNCNFVLKKTMRQNKKIRSYSLL